MILRTISLAALATTATAFSNTSPFFLFSTSPSFSTFHSPNIAHASTITSSLLSLLSSCPSDAYILITQPAVSIADFIKGSGVPHLRNALNTTDGVAISASVVPEVVGEIEVSEIIKVLGQKCSARVVVADAATGEIPSEQAYPRIIKVDFAKLPDTAKERVSKLSDHDSFLHAILTTISSRSYTVLYLTTPPSSQINTPAYEMDSNYDSLHQEFKRDTSLHGTANGPSQAPLFQRYVFLSPAIFMGLFTAFILFMILYVGLSAISGLKVSYFAFSKEMGPSAQKKQQ